MPPDDWSQEQSKDLLISEILEAFHYKTIGKGNQIWVFMSNLQSELENN